MANNWDDIIFDGIYILDPIYQVYVIGSSVVIKNRCGFVRPVTVARKHERLSDHSDVWCRGCGLVCLWLLLLIET